MTLANRITLVRILLVPVFAVLVMSYTQGEPWLRHAALAVFVVAALSDALDGFVARAYNQKSRLGAVLDPLADKLLVNTAYIFLAVNQELATPIPKWFPVIILSRDAIITVGAYLINEYFGPVRVRPRLSGKLTTVFQMGLICAVLLEVSFVRPLLYATVAITLVSFVDYLYQGVRQIGNEDGA